MRENRNFLSVLRERFFEILYRTQTIAYLYANNYKYGVADGQWIRWLRLPSAEFDLRVCFQVEVNKPDTLWLDQKEPQILSRICRFELGKLKAVYNIISVYCISLTKSHSKEEKKIVQATKETTYTLFLVTKHLVKQIPLMNKNQERREPQRLVREQKSKIDYNVGTWDPTASKIPYFQRRRSSHSSNNTKGNSLNLLVKSNEISNFIFLSTKGNEDKLRKVVMKLLDKYKDKNSRYNGIIRIISSPEFLMACYLIIKSKPGNLSPGSMKETLDGLGKEWFENTSKNLMTGKFKFHPARQVLISKANSTDLRPISVGQPREKIVQKAIQVILSAIYENKFLDCSHGFRPNRSTHSALDVLHFKGGSYAWVINGDISKCFDSIPHLNILDSLRKNITCV